MIMTYPDEVPGGPMIHQWITLKSFKSIEEEKKKEENDTYQEFLKDADYRKGIE